MLFLGGDGHTEAEFIRNIAIRSNCPTSLTEEDGTSNISRNSPKSMLRCLLHDLSFWEASSSTFKGLYDGKLPNGKRRQPSMSSTPSTTSTGVSGIGSRNSSRHRERLQRQSSRDKATSDCNNGAIWKTAIDPLSGRMYYYDAITRRTQWHKPSEVRAMEKRQKLEQRQKDLAFFEEMEKNVKISLDRGELIPGVPLAKTEKQGPPLEPGPSKRVRTISGMDDVLLAELSSHAGMVPMPTQTQKQQNHPRKTQSSQSHDANGSANGSSSSRRGRPPLPSGKNGSRRSMYRASESLEVSPDNNLPKTTATAAPTTKSALPEHPFQRVDSELAGEKLLDAPIQTKCDLSEVVMPTDNIPAGHTRRNTGGTIYVQSTIFNPDIEKTIKCVCGVYRAHILQGADRKANVSSTPTMGCHYEIEVFRDDHEYRQRRKPVPMPSLNDVLAFYKEFYRRSQMEQDTIIMSLIYVERLIKETNGVVAPTPSNWRSVLFACMVLASKVWDDLSMWNIDFSNVSANTAGLSLFTLRRINRLELAILKCLNFDVKVPASEYAKYYFLIRTMLLKSGLMQSVEKPLAKQDIFNTLEAKTNNYQDSKLSSVDTTTRERRTKSLDYSLGTWLAGEAQKTGPVLGSSVCLEQLVGQ